MSREEDKERDATAQEIAHLEQIANLQSKDSHHWRRVAYEYRKLALELEHRTRSLEAIQWSVRTMKGMAN